MDISTLANLINAVAVTAGVIFHVTATWETIGVLLFHGELTIDIIDDFLADQS